MCRLAPQRWWTGTAVRARCMGSRDRALTRGTWGRSGGYPRPNLSNFRACHAKHLGKSSVCFRGVLLSPDLLSSDPSDTLARQNASLRMHGLPKCVLATCRTAFDRQVHPAPVWGNAGIVDYLLGFFSGGSIGWLWLLALGRGQANSTRAGKAACVSSHGLLSALSLRRTCLALTHYTRYRGETAELRGPYVADSRPSDNQRRPAVFRSVLDRAATPKLV